MNPKERLGGSPGSREIETRGWSFKRRDEGAVHVRVPKVREEEEKRLSEAATTSIGFVTPFFNISLFFFLFSNVFFFFL